MAERRMFTQKIVDSDAFLDMPLSTQALYFHLNMRADDDGFVNNPKKIQRMIGASEDDLKLLLAKRFILGFESGVVVIKHWRMHNLLRKDRYNPTQYIDEFKTLALNDNGSYTEKPINDLVATTWQPNGNQMATQDRIGKDSIVKYSLGEGVSCDSDEPTPPTQKRIDYQSIVDMFNSICVSLPTVRSLSENRKKAIKARLNTYSVDDIRQCFELAEASSFLKGSNNRNWTATFDWLLKDANMAKVLEGNYADKSGGSVGSFDTDEFFQAARKRLFDDLTPREALEREAAARMDNAKATAPTPETLRRAEELKNKLQGG